MQWHDMTWHGVTSNNLVWRDRTRSDVTSFLCSNYQCIAVVPLLCGAGSHLYCVVGEYPKTSQCLIVDPTMDTTIVIKKMGIRIRRIHQTILYRVSLETSDVRVDNKTPLHENGWITGGSGFDIFRNNIRGWNITKERLFLFSLIAFCCYQWKTLFPGMEWTGAP